jgi:RNA polymerase sigma-70 factor, ECF subfamily
VVYCRNRPVVRDKLEDQTMPEEVNFRGLMYSAIPLSPLSNDLGALRGMALPAMTDSADSILVQASIGGDQVAFTELVTRYRPAVFRIVLRILGNTADNEDAIQEIFIRTMISLEKYDQSYPFAPWILKIASNYCIDQIRRRKARKYKLWSDLSDAEERKVIWNMSSKPPADDSTQADSHGYLEVAQLLLDRLKPRRRMAFVLREIEGRSYEEVAAILGVPETTARVRVWRARNDLNKAFLKHLKKVGRK